MLGKQALNPNEKTELKVSYATKGQPGPFEKEVFFTTNIPGYDKIEIFRMKGVVREAPGAKISVTPRRVVLEGNELAAGKKQAFTMTNEGSLPLVITGIHSKDGKTAYYDCAKDGNITIEPGKSKTIELQLKGKSEETADREMIIIDSNAANAGKTGLFLMIQYSAK
jgi:hypothetical protein